MFSRRRMRCHNAGFAANHTAECQEVLDEADRGSGGPGPNLVPGPVYLL